MDVIINFVAFGVTFAFIHYYITLGAAPAADYLSAGEAKATCEKDDFFCADDKRRTGDELLPFFLSRGVEQTMDGSPEEVINMRAVHAAMVEYMLVWIKKYSHVESLMKNCVNKNAKCVFWTSIGECSKNPTYMEAECRLACLRCEKLLETPQVKAEL